MAIAINHKGLEDLNKFCEEKYPHLRIKEYYNEEKGNQKRKYVLVTDGTQEKWIMWSNFMKRGCKFTKPSRVWNIETMSEYIKENNEEDILLLETWTEMDKKWKTSRRFAVVTNGKVTKTIDWNHTVSNLKGKIYMYGQLKYKDDVINKMIEEKLSDCTIHDIFEKEGQTRKGNRLERLYVKYTYKKREMENTLKWVLSRNFENNYNEDTLKERYKSIDYDRFEVLRIYSKRKSGKYRTLVDFKDTKYNEVLIGMDTSNLPETTLSGTTLSVGELRIKEWLVENNINHETQKTFHDLKYVSNLKLDFYLPDYNMAIEYDGILHFIAYESRGGEEQLKENKIRDKVKDDYCKENNIRLLRIPYYEYKNIANILSQEIV